ncbi:hypothetical protein [Candidatus Poriferisodalis sp.]
MASGRPERLPEWRRIAVKAITDTDTGTGTEMNTVIRPEAWAAPFDG